MIPEKLKGNKAIAKLSKCFPENCITKGFDDSFIFVLHRDAKDITVCVRPTDTVHDLIIKFLQYGVWSTYSNPKCPKSLYAQFHEYNLRGWNKFLETSFTVEDMPKIELVGVRSEWREKFIESGLSKEWLEQKYNLWLNFHNY